MKMLSKGTLMPSRALGVAAVSFFFLGSNFFFFFFGASSLGGSTLVSAFCRFSCSLLSFSSRSAARSSLAFALRFILAAFFLAVLPVSSASVEATDAGWWRSNDAKWFGSFGAICKELSNFVAVESVGARNDTCRDYYVSWIPPLNAI